MTQAKHCPCCGAALKVLCRALREAPTGTSTSSGRAAAVVRGRRLPYTRKRHAQKEWLQGRKASASRRSALPRCSPSKPCGRRPCEPARGTWQRVVRIGGCSPERPQACPQGVSPASMPASYGERGWSVDHAVGAKQAH